MKTPVLFLSHGSPMFALEPGTTGAALRSWIVGLEAAGTKPKAVLIMSPHWMTRIPVAMTTPKPPTWHDFGGFPPALYDLRYPAEGNPALAQQVQNLLLSAGIDCASDDQRPYDHGAWVPLLHLLPKADVPVVQLSLPAYYSPAQLMALGKALVSLREQGVLIIASGSMTHNLSEFSHDRSLNALAKPYVIEFARWVETCITSGDIESLLNYRALAPHAERAHPTDEHFVPLYFALGAAGGDAPIYLSREVMAGRFAMDAVAFG
jgi:4,5-DOPA dioxygenase extradiol